LDGQDYRYVTKFWRSLAFLKDFWRSEVKSAIFNILLLIAFCRSIVYLWIWHQISNLIRANKWCTGCQLLATIWWWSCQKTVIRKSGPRESTGQARPHSPMKCPSIVLKLKPLNNSRWPKFCLFIRHEKASKPGTKVSKTEKIAVFPAFSFIFSFYFPIHQNERKLI
jgi:hypothetical protein